MKKTVLQYVQTAMSIMDSDEVDTISETVESVQVAEQLKETYYELLNRQEWPFLHRPIGMLAAGDVSQPTRFNSPDGLKRLTSLRYNISDDLAIYQGKELIWLEPSDFLQRFSVGGDSRDLVLLEQERLQFYVANDRDPTFYTSFDDSTIYCDAYKASRESTLLSTRMIATGVFIPAFVVEDAFVPQLPEEMVPLLQASLNNASMLYFKQQPSSVDASRELRQMAQARRRQNKFTSSKGAYYQNRYGRK